MSALPAKSSSAIHKKRLPEIDLFRAFAILYMGITHGVFHMPKAPRWAVILSSGGIFFCYIGFLLAFAMAQAIIEEHGSLRRPGGRRRMMTQTWMILLGYYLIAFGGNLDMLTHHSWKTIIRMALLQDVPKAGDFFLSFLIYILLILTIKPLMSWIIRRPLAAFMISIFLNLAGNFFAHITAPAAISGWWKIVFGAAYGARTFPVLGYTPLFVIGVWIGWSYIKAPSHRNWAATVLPFSFSALLLSSLLSWGIGLTVWKTASSLQPIPGMIYIITAAASGITLFCVVSLASVDRDWPGVSPAGKFLNYVGRNAFWIIVWQYLWIGAGEEKLHLAKSLGTTAFLLTMMFLPPLFLSISQRLGKIVPYRNAPAIKDAV